MWPTLRTCTISERDRDGAVRSVVAASTTGPGGPNVKSAPLRRRRWHMPFLGGIARRPATRRPTANPVSLINTVPGMKYPSAVACTGGRRWRHGTTGKTDTGRGGIWRLCAPMPPHSDRGDRDGANTDPKENEKKKKIATSTAVINLRYLPIVYNR